ncbi:MAG: M20/M25/M40 family metallo-hydrolase [Sporolactobacillus sp.]
MSRIDEERLIKQFTDLVIVDSETGKEAAIASVLKEIFSDLDLEVTEDQAKELTGHGANNLICTLSGNRPGKTILFGVHMDTVIPGQSIKPSIKDGYLVSDGTTILGADDKAGISALIEAIQVIQENQLPHATIQFVITIGEESGLVGAKALDTKLIKAAYGFELDSDGPVGDIIIAAPNQAKITAELFGKTAHAGISPEKGVSAITLAAKAIAKMPLGRIDEETTANIGRFEGGQATNIVCDYVRILAETRSLNRSKMDQQIKLMQNAFETMARKMGGRALVNTQIMYTGYRFAPEDPFVQLTADAIRTIGCKPRLLTTGGGSDANVFCGKGIPVLNLGVGYENIHTTKERMPISELVKVSELVLALVEQARR